jgi:hypothetical protein
MAVAKWSTPGTRSDATTAGIAGATFNSLANGSAGAAMGPYDNSTLRDLYAAITIKLGSLNVAAGGSITLRVYSGDGTDTPNLNGGAFDSYIAPLTTGTSAKIVTFPQVRIYPFSNIIFQLVNNAGVSTAASGNEFYMRTYNEEVT